jgi:tetratricopeptide (TPR) repeat protein
LLLTDYYKGGLFSRRAVLDKLPFLAGALAFGWYSLSSSTLKADQYSEPISFFTRIVYSFQAYWWYVVKCFFPVAQTAIYSFPEQGSTESMLLLIGGALLAALTVAGVIYFWKRNLLACFGLLFFAATTFPTLHLLALNSSLIYERFTYLSYIGLFVFAAALPDSLPSLRRWLPVLMWVTLLPFAALTYQRTGVWKSSYTLWTDVIEKNPRSHEALNNRGAWYNERGEIDKALTDINASISLNPRQPRAYNNRSMIHFLKKDYASSLRDVDSALVMEPKLAEAWCNRGNAFFDLKQYDSAISNYTMALKYSPNFPSNYANRGSAYLKKGDFLLARKDYEKAISQAANDGSSWRLCALAYAELEEHDKALAAMQRALELGQSDAAAMLSSEYVQMGLRAWADKTNSADKVLRYYQRAAEVDSRNYQAWYELGGMYYVKKDLPKARENWKKALEALPTYAEARMWLERTGGVN